LDVSASRCVGESSTCRERKSGAENKRSAKRDFSGREHCLILSDQFAVFAAHCDGQTSSSIAILKQIVRLVDYSPSGLLQDNWSIKAL
jgi:hypothetical protein